VPLDPRQRQNAQLIYSIARSQGVSHERAIELVAAANAESGLRADATNKSSGAAGFFQLLSQGYRDRAQKLGGLYDPRANTMAILPDYQSYWRSHPNAAPGEAARDVERSGMGADFYDDTGQFSWLRGGGSSPAASPGVAAAPPGTTAAPSPQLVGPSQQELRRQFALQLIQSRRARRTGGDPNQAGLMQALSAVRRGPQYETPSAAASVTTGPGMSFPAEPLPSGKGSANAATMMALMKEAQRRGLRVGENPYFDQVDPVHVTNSLHYQTFPQTFNGRALGRGADITGTPEQMAAYFNWVRAYYPGINELIYDPLGSSFGGTFSNKPYGGHRTHVHVGVA